MDNAGMYRYGTMEQTQESTRPLLVKQSYQQPEFTVGSSGSSRQVVTKKDHGGEPRLRTVRTSAVLSAIMEKPRHDKRQDDSVMQPDTGSGSAPPIHCQSKSFIYTMLNPRSKSWEAVSFKWFITLVIIAVSMKLVDANFLDGRSVMYLVTEKNASAFDRVFLQDLIAFVVSTEPDLNVHQQHVFYVWEGVTSTVFLIEYITRLVVVTEARKYMEKGPMGGRVSYALTWPALIDFLATFPFFIELMTGLSLPTLTYLRAFRLLRILKTSGFADATNAVYRVIYYNRQILYVAMLICIGLVVFTAVLMYYLRPKDPNHSQDFRSLSRTMYLSTLMLTGQGGPDGELPWYTKGVVVMTGVFSIGMFAIPASMLTWGFEAEAERLANLAYARARKPTSQVECDNWSFSSDDYSTDEEYRKIIAGADDGGYSDEDAAAQKAFLLADIDGSGSISLTEYLAMSRAQAMSKTTESPSGLSSKDLSVRLISLEQKVAENSEKLDKIIQILQDLEKRL